jgi:hypothetical protein
MKGVNESGVEIESRRVDAPEVGGVLSDMDVGSLRRFVLGIMRAGGVPFGRMAKVMRTSKASISRDARASKSEV